MSKYDPLRIYLQNSKQDVETLRFQQVEQILGFQLPDSAYDHRPWWGNEENEARSQANAWRNAGWKVTGVELGVTVTFSKVTNSVHTEPLKSKGFEDNLNKEQGKRMAKGREIDVENKIRELIENNIIGEKEDFTLLDNKDVTDIIVCRNTAAPKIFFIEVKHFSSSNARMGFGDGSGNGFQPEILTKRPKYLEENLRWVFQHEYDTGYYVLTNEDCRTYSSGGFIGDKQNNFQSRLFDEIPAMNEADFVQYLKNWFAA